MSMRLLGFGTSIDRLREQYEDAQTRTLTASEELEAILAKLEKFRSDYWQKTVKEILEPERIDVALDGHLKVDIVNGQLDNAKGLIVRGQMNELSKLMAMPSVLEARAETARTTLMREKQRMEKLKADLDRRTKQKGKTNA